MTLEKPWRTLYHSSMKSSIQNQMADLADTLRSYQRAYYVDGESPVSDTEYDRLFDQLVLLEQEYPEFKALDSPTVRVGSDLTSDFPEVRHTIPVLSLDKAYSAQAILQWMEKTEQKSGALSFTVEEKIDGVSIVLYYEQGVLVRAVTRGNGTIGNDVTANIKTIASVPLRLSEPVTLAVRGEVYLPISDFQSINKSLETPYANPRNLAAGTVRRIKSSETAKTPLRIFVYEGFWSNPSQAPHTHVGIISALKQYGFRINPNLGLFANNGAAAQTQLQDSHLMAQAGDFQDLPAYIQACTERRKSLDYEIDGLVLKVNELEVRDRLGYTEHHPRWAIAYKFEAPEAETSVQDIDVQIGRTGRATPVARVKPVAIGGSTVSNITLHNQQYINELELAIGDTIAISRRGDVIPAVERVLEKNEEGHTTWQMPHNCPICHFEMEERGAHSFCPNADCPAQVLGRISFFIGKGQMDIDGFGPETAQFLIDKGWLHDVPDIYTCDYARLIGEPGFGEKKVHAIVKGVEASRNKPYRNVLVSLGIPEFGKKAVDLLIKDGLTSIDQLLELADSHDIARLSSIKQIGPRTAELLITALNNPAMRKRISRLKDAGLQFEEHTQVGVTAPQIFEGQVWAITGSFTHFNPRTLAQEEIEKRGGRTVSSITGKTTHLLAGSGAGSKLHQARQAGAAIVDEEAFLKLLGSDVATVADDEPFVDDLPLFRQEDV